MKCNLTLHCGASLVDRADVWDVATPEPTRTWHPIPHHNLLCLVENTLKRNQLTVVEQAHSLTHDGKRYFGLLQVVNGNRHDDFSWVLGVRNAHDKKFPAGIVAGAQVFVCDNLSFNGEIKLARRHTRYILRDLPNLTAASIQTLLSRWHHIENRFDAYKQHKLEDWQVHDLLIQSVDCGVCPVTVIPQVLLCWRKPPYEAFGERTVWSLFNGFTEALKGNLAVLPQRTERLHHLLDTYVGLNPRQEWVLDLEELEMETVP